MMSADTLGRTITARARFSAPGRGTPTGHEAWREQAACLGADVALFFHPEAVRGAARSGRTLEAKAICDACPVRLACRDQARAAREPYGIRGGETEEERKAWLKAQARRAAAKAKREAAA